METLLQDLRYATRSLLKSKSFALVVLITLTLGIGANTAIFSVVNAILLQPLPYRQPERLVMVWQDWSARNGPKQEWFNFPDFTDWRAQSTVIEDMAIESGSSMVLTGSGEPERLSGRLVSESYFRVLGVEPAIGRSFGRGDFEASARVVLLSDGLWKRRFNADPRIVGQAITLNGEPYAIIGVMGPDFRAPLAPQAALFRMIRLEQTTSGCYGSRGCVTLRAIARLKPGVTVERAEADFTTVAQRLEQQYPESNGGRHAADVVGLQQQLTGETRQALLTLLGAVAFVLLIACANIANLLLARGAGREREVAIRTALGAARSRLVRQLLTESLLLAVMGAGLGLLVAVWGVDLLKAMIPPDVTALFSIGISTPVLLFTLGLALASGVLFGLAPAIHGTKTNLTESFKEGGRGSTGSAATRRLRGGLVMAEMAVALTLLIGSALMMKSFLRLQSVNPGFDPRNVLIGDIQLSSRAYPNDTVVVAFYAQLLERLQRYPQIEAAALSHSLPLSGRNTDGMFEAEGRPALKPGEGADIWTRNVTPGYHSTMRVKILRGRSFTAADRMGTPEVAIINELTAKRLWPGEDPIGKRMRGARSTANDWITVVGVATDVRHEDLSTPPRMEAYFPFAQQPGLGMMFALRAKANPDLLTPIVRAEIAQMDPNVPIANASTYESVTRESLMLPRLYMALFGLFATVALALAAVGIYGVIAYSVAQRTHEIGVRMALGARGEDVLRMILREGGTLVGAGIVVGLLVAFAIRKVLDSLLFEISTRDPMIFVGVPVVLGVVALVATLIPARRATRVEPSTALRYE